MTSSCEEKMDGHFCHILYHYIPRNTAVQCIAPRDLKTPLHRTLCILLQCKWHLWEHQVLFNYHFIFMLIVMKCCSQRGWPGWNSMPLGQQTKKTLVQLSLQWSKTVLLKRSGQCQCFAPRAAIRAFFCQKMLGQENSSQPFSDFAVLAESEKT